MNPVAVGYFSRTHGTKGQLILKLQADIDSEAVKALFVEVSGSMAPYFVKEFKESQDDLIVSLEEIDSIEKAKLLLNKSVSVDAQHVFEEEENDWLAYELIEKNFGSLGQVVSVSDNGSQVLWHFKFRNKEVILPLVEDFIERIEENEKIIYYAAPEGLIEVYLESE